MRSLSIIILLLVMTGTLLAVPVSNRNQVQDLLNELIWEALAEETGIWDYELSQGEVLGSYLNDILRDLQVRQGTGQAALLIQLSQPELEFLLNSDESSERNQSFLRQFKLGMHVVITDIESGTVLHEGLHTMKGRDHIKASDLLAVMEEPFPLEPVGDYNERDSGGHLVLLLSISSLTALAALYFLRSA